MKNTAMMKPGLLTAAGGYLLLVISLFMPYLTASAFGFSESVSHFSIPYIGKISFLLGLAGLAVAALSLLRGGRVALLVLAIVQTVWSVLTLLFSSMSVSSMGMGAVSRSVGFWFFMIATVAVLVGAVMNMKADKAANSAYTGA